MYMSFLVSQVRLLDLMGRVSPVEKRVHVNESVRHVGTSSAVFATTEGARRKTWLGIIRGDFSCEVTETGGAFEGY